VPFLFANSLHIRSPNSTRKRKHARIISEVFYLHKNLFPNCFLMLPLKLEHISHSCPTCSSNVGIVAFPRLLQESFSCGFDVNEGLNVKTCAEYESFSFDPIITNHLFEPSKSEFLESETFVPIITNLDQTLEHAKIKRLVDLRLINVPRRLVHGDQLATLMTSLLACCEYICLFHDLAQQFDHLKRTLNCTTLIIWTYSFRFQHSDFYCFFVIDSYFL